MRIWAVLVFLGAARAQTNIDTVCRSIISTLDCSSFNVKPICGSDGVQYNTECEFTKAHCLDSNLKVVKEGPCSSGSTGVTQPDASVSTTTTTGAMGMTTDPNLSPICNQIVNTACHPDDNPLCATDGQTYPNYCRFSKARCYLPGLQIAYAGTCSGTDTFPPLTSPPSTTRQPTVFEIICRTLLQATCEQTGVAVCGSDGVTYPTACDFEKAKCNDVSLTVREC